MIVRIMREGRELATYDTATINIGPTDDGMEITLMDI